MGALVSLGAQLDKATKIMYKNGAVDQQISDTPFLNSLRAEKIVPGKYNQQLGMSAYPQSVGPTSNRGDLPEPQEPTLIEPSFDVVDQYAILDISGPEAKRLQTAGGGAMLNWMDMKMRAVKTASDIDIECQLFFGATGLRGIMNAAMVAGSTVTGTLTTAYRPIKWILPNTVLEFRNASTLVVEAYGKVTSVSKTAGTFVIETLTGNVSSGAYVYRKGSYNYCINGIGNVCDDSTGAATFMGVTSTTQAGSWGAYVSTNSGTARDLTFPILDTLLYASQEQNGRSLTDLVMDWNQMRLLANMHTRILSFSNQTGKGMTLNGHNEVETYGKAKVIVSPFAPAGVIYGIQRHDLHYYEAQAWTWITEENAKNIWQKTQGKHVFEATAWFENQLTCDRRSLHGRLGDLTAS